MRPQVFDAKLKCKHSTKWRSLMLSVQSELIGVYLWSFKFGLILVRALQ